MTKFKLKGKKINTPVDHFVILGKGVTQTITTRKTLEKQLAFIKGK